MDVNVVVDPMMRILVKEALLNTSKEVLNRWRVNKASGSEKRKGTEKAASWWLGRGPKKRDNFMPPGYGRHKGGWNMAALCNEGKLGGNGKEGEEWVPFDLCSLPCC